MQIFDYYRKGQSYLLMYPRTQIVHYCCSIQCRTGHHISTSTRSTSAWFLANVRQGRALEHAISFEALQSI